jgi:hypothetical protein
MAELIKRMDMKYVFLNEFSCRWWPHTFSCR